MARTIQLARASAWGTPSGGGGRGLAGSPADRAGLEGRPPALAALTTFRIGGRPGRLIDCADEPSLIRAVAE
ncbi:MAG: hypothetical protein LBD90_01130, partial [Bifidobacteriaceae bacterium]|nr:hypothetical protein [Bifidobacteriaceae bacterium]